MELDHVRARQLRKLPLGPAGEQMKLRDTPIFLGGPLFALGVDMVFEKPLESIAREGQPLLVDAIAWGGSIRPVMRAGQSDLAVAVSSYVRLNPSRPDGKSFTEPRTKWVYLGQSTWPMNDAPSC